MQRAAAAYFQTKVTTTDQGDIVVMLYDGAIKFLNQAVEHLAANDMAQKGLALSRALDVINELDSALNMEKGGSLSENLHSLYLFCSNHLVTANLKKDPERIGHVIKILSGLRSAYSEILTLPEAREAAQKAAASLRANTTPIRAQTGTTGMGASAPAPGVNARLRNFYAAQETAADAAGRERTTDREAGIAAPREGNSEPTAPEKRHPADAAASPSAETDTDLIGRNFAAPSGVSARTGASAYQKLSGS